MIFPVFLTLFLVYVQSFAVKAQCRCSVSALQVQCKCSAGAVQRAVFSAVVRVFGVQCRRSACAVGVQCGRSVRTRKLHCNCSVQEGENFGAAVFCRPKLAQCKSRGFAVRGAVQAAAATRKPRALHLQCTCTAHAKNIFSRGIAKSVDLRGICSVPDRGSSAGAVEAQWIRSRRAVHVQCEGLERIEKRSTRPVARATVS